MAAYLILVEVIEVLLRWDAPRNPIPACARPTMVTACHSRRTSQRNARHSQGTRERAGESETIGRGGEAATDVQRAISALCVVGRDSWSWYPGRQYCRSRCTDSAMYWFGLWRCDTFEGASARTSTGNAY
eukprot:2831980-Rhodomonas_salina.2